MAWPARLPEQQQQRNTGASRARSAEIYHLSSAAGYEAGVREPGSWDHIGRHMRADAEPVRRTRRTVRRPGLVTRLLRVLRPLRDSQALADLVIAFLLVGVIAATAFGVI